MKNKKAIFLTVSAFFLATLILILAVTTYNYTDKEKIERTYEVSALDRLFDLSSSVEKGVLSIFRLYVFMDMEVVVNPDGTYNITIMDRLSRTEGKLGSEFNSQIENFKTFVESKDKNVYVNLTTLEGNELPLKIEDYNITYTRSWEIGHIVLSITPETLNFRTYDVIINTESEKIQSMSAPGIKSGTFPFRVIGIDNYGHLFTESHNIDPSGNSQVQIKLKNDIKVIVDANVLKIWTNSNSRMSIRATIGYIAPLNHEPKINFFENAVKVNFPEMGISKNIPVVV